MEESKGLDLRDLDVRELTDEELVALSGGGNVKYCPMGTFKMCDMIDGVRKCWCERLAGNQNPLNS